MSRTQAWWFARQDLVERVSRSPLETITRAGWMRSVGSANPYLAIRARGGCNRAEIEEAVANVELVEIPAARGCTYYVPADEAAIALRLAAMGTASAEFRMAERHLGVTDVEVGALAERILRAIETSPMDARSLSASCAPRNLGEAGKKRGMTTTLSLALSRLQVSGSIRRLPQDGRLDTERYRYTTWDGGPNAHDIHEEELAERMAGLYFRWIGPATEGEFRDFTGLSAKLSKSAVTQLSTCPSDPTRLMRPEDIDAFESTVPSNGQVVLLSSLDPWLHFRRNLPTLMNPLDDALRIPYGKDLSVAGNLKDIDSHPIVCDGAIIGLWEFDAETQSIAYWTWRPSSEVEAEVAKTEKWISSELGDFRSFSLDSMKSRAPRIEMLRSLFENRQSTQRP